VANLVAAAFETAGRIAEASAVEEKKEADPARKKRDGEDGVGGAVGGAEADGEGVVVVVDELEAPGRRARILRRAMRAWAAMSGVNLSRKASSWAAGDGMDAARGADFFFAVFARAGDMVREW